MFYIFLQAIELNNDNIDQYIGNNNYVILEFYTKWCHYCKLLSPEYNKLAEEYNNKRKDIIISRIEGQANDFTLQRYGIFRFPVIVLFKPHSKAIYSIFQNQRTYDELNKWVNESCPDIREEGKSIFKTKNDKIKINICEIEKSQNLTAENEYIKNEFIDINKRIEKLKNLLNLNDNKNINNSKKNNKVKVEFDFSPLFLLFSFSSLLIIILIGSYIKNIFFTNKHHMK